MKIKIPLDGRQVDHPQRTQPGRVIGLVLRHDFASAVNDAPDAGFAHVHVMRLLHQHEARGPGQRIETRLSQCQELEFSVTVREVGEHEECQPVRSLFVEGAQNPRIVLIS